MGRSTRGIDYQDIPRPVAGLSDEIAAGYYDPPHSHRRAQLLYASRGVLLITTRETSFVVPPLRAVWMPSRVEHEVFAREPASIRTLYVEPDVRPELPQHCCVVEVTELLRELVLEACRLPILYELNGRNERVMSLILDELATMRTTSLHVPMPQDERLVKVCNALLRDPAHKDDLNDLADAAIMGRRSFTRLFRRETGVSFATWRQNVRLMQAMSRLALGEPVTKVAFDVGYSSSSAFTAMFRRTFGVAPTRYLSHQGNDSLHHA
jgi:AraC-like DNA-binding protein